MVVCTDKYSIILTMEGMSMELEKTHWAKMVQKMRLKCFQVGYQIVCDDDEEKEEEAKENDPNCEHAAKVASKYGYMINCDDID